MLTIDLCLLSESCDYLVSKDVCRPPHGLLSHAIIASPPLYDVLLRNARLTDVGH